MRTDPTAVTACIPYFRCRRYVRRAVESLLAQTHRNLTVVVVNDGDTQPPWDLLGDIRDARLIRFSLQANWGPYFATAVALNATSAPYFVIQDADDWSAPERVARLLEKIESEHSDLVVSARPICTEGVGGRLERRYTMPAFKLCTPPSAELVWRFHHHGLWRVRSLVRIGGYYGGFRLSYDMFLTNLIFLTGRVSGVDAPLYYVYERPDSLSRDHATALRSPARARVERQLARMYREVYHDKMRFLKQQLGSAEFMERIRSVCSRHVAPEAKAALDWETRSLSIFLQDQ